MLVCFCLFVCLFVVVVVFFIIFLLSFSTFDNELIILYSIPEWSTIYSWYLLGFPSNNLCSYLSNIGLRGVGGK